MKLTEVKIPIIMVDPQGAQQTTYISIDESEQLRKYLFKAELQAMREVESSQVLH